MATRRGDRKDTVMNPADTNPAVTISDLRDVDELKRLFNDDRGALRLILLLSPT